MCIRDRAMIARLESLGYLDAGNATAHGHARCHAFSEGEDIRLSLIHIYSVSMPSSAAKWLRSATSASESSRASVTRLAPSAASATSASFVWVFICVEICTRVCGIVRAIS